MERRKKTLQSEHSKEKFLKLGGKHLMLHSYGKLSCWFACAKAVLAWTESSNSLVKWFAPKHARAAGYRRLAGKNSRQKTDHFGPLVSACIALLQ